ncbi:LPXTG cell wall anchor domain-containing protein [Enterococcus sp. AZ072]|uniref:LPXTG cell wall anchor domain-containing protein n=1 Tax=unclassified Enterococcus TaxID=2608891 RepID=UPI003D2D632D
MRKLRILFSSILCFCFFFCGMPTVQAAKALPPGMVIGDSDGMYATSEGEYYIDLVGILPGDIFEKEITIRSLDLEAPFSLGMLVEEIDSSGSVDWKNHIMMTLALDGKEIYHGPLLGDASRDWSKTPLELGVCTYGTDKIMHATFTIDSSLTNEDLNAQSTLNFSWNFVGTKDQPTEPTKPTEPTEPTKPTEPSTEPTIPSTSTSSSGTLPATGQGTPTAHKLLPQTGEELVYLFLTGLLLVLIVLFLWKKRQEEEQE